MSRHIFISASALAQEWSTIPAAVLEHALFFFGSKKIWLFPKNKEQEEEARRQPGAYHLMDREFLELVSRKLERGHVFFLKREDLPYRGYPGPDDSKAYARANEWIQKASIIIINYYYY